MALIKISRENFRGWSKICKNCKGFLPHRFCCLWYKFIMLKIYPKYFLIFLKLLTYYVLHASYLSTTFLVLLECSVSVFDVSIEVHVFQSILLAV